MENKLKIVFVGIPDMAVVCLNNLIEKKFDIVCAVPPEKEHSTYSYFKNMVQQRGLNLIEFEKTPNEPSCIEKIKAFSADIGVVCSYNKLLTKEFLSSTKMGYLNCHPSALPLYRGAMPYFHIVKNRQKESAITIHFMDEKFDTGDIVYQETFKLLPWETMGTLFNRTTYMISDALVKILKEIQEGKTLNRIPQPKGEFIKAPMTQGSYRINWSKDVFETQALIRACNPFYNAYTSFRDTTLKIIKASAIEKEHNLKFGQIALTDEKDIFIASQGGFLLPEIMEIGTWGVFGPREFYYTFSPKTDEFLI